MEMKKYKLGEMGRVVTGKTPSTKDADNFNGNIPFITPEDIAKGFRIDNTNRFISENGYESIKSNTLNAFSVLVGCIGSDMGNVAFSENKCATNQQINAITNIKDSFCPLFIYYLLSTKKQYFRQFAGSTTTPILPKSVFENIEVMLPEFSTQQKIAAVLSALDDKIALNRRMNAKLEQMAKRLYDHWFVQFDFPRCFAIPFVTLKASVPQHDSQRHSAPERSEGEESYSQSEREESRLRGDVSAVPQHDYQRHSEHREESIVFSENQNSTNANGFVYIVTNKNKTTLYIGVTNDLKRRIYEHKNHVVKGFTDKYNCEYLVYFECFTDIREAITREKYLKGKKRDFKENLINSINPNWKDLYDLVIQNEREEYRDVSPMAQHDGHSERSEGEESYSQGEREESRLRGDVSGVRPQHDAKPYKASGGKMVWNETLKREIPAGWEVKRLGEIEPTIITGKTPSTAVEDNFGGKIPFITIDDIRQSKFVCATERTLSDKGSYTQKNKFLPEKSLCCSCIGTIGLIGFTVFRSQTNQQINSVIFAYEENREYLYFSLKQYFEKGFAKIGNVFANMSKEEFSSIQIILPPKEIISAFNEKTLSIFSYQLSISKEIQKLTALRDRLLPLLMNGQVEVKENF